MSRFLGILAVLAVVLLAMGFAAANAGHRVAINLGLFTLYRVPVTLVAFSGLLVGMVVMFATGVQTDLKVRRILRERLAEETHEEQRWIDGNQQDLFAGAGAEGRPESDPTSESPVEMESDPNPGDPVELDSDPTPESPVEFDSLPTAEFPFDEGELKE